MSRRIHQAVVELLREGGQEACTFQAVAARAGVERSTLYRRYANRWAMLAEAFAEHHVDILAFEPSGSFRTDLLRHLEKLAETLSSSLGAAMLAAGAVARTDPSSRPVAGLFWQSRKARQRGFVQAAIERGELPPAVDLDELFALAEGPLYFRLLIIAKPIDRDWVERTVERVCRAFCIASAKAPETAS